MKWMYIAAPIFGVPDEIMRASFAKGAQLATTAGFKPCLPIDVKPFSHGLAPCPPGRAGLDGHTDACHLHADLLELLHCEALLLMDGWAASWGAKLELNVATAVGLRIAVQHEEHGLVWIA
jgi:hypothetical protein